MQNRIPAIIVTLVAAAFFAGCQQQQRTEEAPNEKQARLIAAQSADLQKQLAAREAELTTLRHKHAQDLQQRDNEIAACKARIETLQREIDKGIAERVSGVTAAIMEENAKLREEIKQLKAKAQKQAQP